MGNDENGPLDVGQVWTAQSLAKAEGLNSSRIRQLCIEGDRFPNAFKLGKTWLIPDADVKAWRATDRDRRFSQWSKKADD